MFVGRARSLKTPPPLSAQGFNESKIPKATANDIRYTQSKDGRYVYAIVLVPPADGHTPRFAALGDRIAAARRLAQVKDLPAVWKIE